MTRALAYAPAAAWAAVLLLLGGQTTLHAPPTTLPLDKFAHFGIYAVLGVLTGFGWVRIGRRRSWILPVAAALLVGAADELHQRGVDGRSAEFADWVADALGVGVGFMAVARVRRVTKGTIHG